jgi:hypothetical protein
MISESDCADDGDVRNHRGPQLGGTSSSWKPETSHKRHDVHKWWIGKDLEGGDRGPSLVLCKYVLRQWGTYDYFVIPLRFELGTSWIKIWNVTFTPTLSESLVVYFPPPPNILQADRHQNFEQLFILHGWVCRIRINYCKGSDGKKMDFKHYYYYYYYYWWGGTESLGICPSP